MLQRNVATFDIGGTNIRAATIAISGIRNWQIVDTSHRSTPNYVLAPEISVSQRLQYLIDFVTEYASQSRDRFATDCVVAAFPGPIQNESTVLALPTIWGPEGQTACPIDLAGMINERLPSMLVKVMNDVTSAGYRFAVDVQDFALFTLGSGIGLKVFIGGRPCVGRSGMGGEITHMVFDSRTDAPVCDCGGRGHLGALASGRAWQRELAKANAREQDPDLSAFTDPLAQAVAMLHFSLGLERFFFSGGLAEGLGEALRASIVDNLPKHGWDIGQDWDAMINLAPADDSHALIGGALSLFF